jgi:hypothetical protein
LDKPIILSQVAVKSVPGQTAQRAKTQNPIPEKSFSLFSARQDGFTKTCCAKTTLFAQHTREYGTTVPRSAGFERAL